MKLFYTQNSPYARRPRIAVREAGLLGGKVEEVDCAPLGTPDNVLFTYGPGGKVPALLTDNGTFVRETLLISRLLDDASGGKLYPADAKAKEAAIGLESLASLLMETLFVRAHEVHRRDPKLRSEEVVTKETARAAACYDALEGMVDGFAGPLHLGTIGVAAALGYADWRHPGDNWRTGRPKLAAWHAEIDKRPSMQETAVVP